MEACTYYGENLNFPRGRSAAQEHITDTDTDTEVCVRLCTFSCLRYTNKDKRGHNEGGRCESYHTHKRVLEPNPNLHSGGSRGETSSFAAAEVN